jgi:hypothetical protein
MGQAEKSHKHADKDMIARESTFLLDDSTVRIQ